MQVLGQVELVIMLSMILQLLLVVKGETQDLSIKIKLLLQPVVDKAVVVVIIVSMHQLVAVMVVMVVL